MIRRWVRGGFGLRGVRFQFYPVLPKSGERKVPFGEGAWGGEAHDAPLPVRDIEGTLPSADTLRHQLPSADETRAAVDHMDSEPPDGDEE